MCRAVPVAWTPPGSCLHARTHRDATSPVVIVTTACRRQSRARSPEGSITLSPRYTTGRPSTPDWGRPKAEVLTDRLAAALVDHEPGWRLPRRSDLARRFGATAAELEAALTNLARLGMIRVMADGQVYRASPAEFLITLEGVPCLGSRIDAMGTVLTQASRQVLRRAVPQEITSALRLPRKSGACAVQSTWATDGTVTAVSTTYLRASFASALVLENAGMVLTRRELLHVVRRPGDADHAQTLDAHIRSLRHKLDSDLSAPRIRTVRGVGYIFDIAPASGLRATARS
jgi:hypothetical protein